MEKVLISGSWGNIDSRKASRRLGHNTQTTVELGTRGETRAR